MYREETRSRPFIVMTFSQLTAVCTHRSGGCVCLHPVIQRSKQVDIARGLAYTELCEGQRTCPVWGRKAKHRIRVDR